MTEPGEEQEGVEFGRAVKRLTPAREDTGRRPGRAVVARTASRTRQAAVRGIRRIQRRGRRAPRVEAIVFVPEGFDPNDVLDMKMVRVTDATMGAIVARRC